MEDELDCSMVDGMGLATHVLAKWLLERPNVELQVLIEGGCAWPHTVRFTRYEHESFVDLICD